MNNDFDKILDECIDRMNSGQSIDECLRLHPEYAGELDPLLRAIGELREQSSVVPSEAAKAKGRLRLHQTLHEINRERNMPKKSPFWRLFSRPMVWAPITAVLLVLLTSLGIWNMLNNNETAPITAIATPPAVTTVAPPGTTIPSATPTTIPPTTPAITPPVTPTTTPPATTIVAYAGILEIRVTDDPPAHDISAVNMTIGNIQVNKRQVESGQTSVEEASEETGWQTIIEESRRFELLELRGIEKVLGSKELEAGHYTQIRLDVESVTVTANGKAQSAKVPNGTLKLVGAFDIEVGEKTALTLDFDAAKSVVITGNGEIIFEPVVKLIVAKGQ